uniref:potassium/sodium hyperpolarization-activated cyclic nucleotide-gated channel 2-like n=1 Tax=Panthera onca TaxID=9690 RepID=UPI002953E489|nr:potassium/sodium hyperpolarization-activated cyclic nucleotide-gated channel 2-like [Panthera onca]
MAVEVANNSRSSGRGERRSRLGHCGSAGSPPAPRPPSSPSTAPPPPRRPQPREPELADRPYLRDASSEGGERPGTCANSCFFGRPRSASPRSGGRRHPEQNAQERGGKGHAAREESRAASELARPPPAHPACKARSPRRARRARRRRPGPGRGLLQGGPGHGAVTCPAVTPRPPGTGPSAAATQHATLRARGHRGRYYLEGLRAAC